MRFVAVCLLCPPQRPEHLPGDTLRSSPRVLLSDLQGWTWGQTGTPASFDAHPTSACPQRPAGNIPTGICSDRCCDHQRGFQVAEWC